VVIPSHWSGAVIQVKKRNQIDEGWQRNFMGALLLTSQSTRICVAVSEDADPYYVSYVMWNITTRVNPHTDILNPIPGGRVQTFMPAEPMTAGDKERTASNTRFEGGMGIDCTVPCGYESDFIRPVYAVDKVDLKTWFSDDQIANGKDRRKGWVNSLARTGR
jgi:3-polyprenyl-4-hydroxybenzoate decarboxylase